jgi:hypothetical protein
MCEDGSRGSTVVGVVVRDCGGHAFVPHKSHGIQFIDCISHDTFDDAYWYDRATQGAKHSPPTDDLHYIRCVASLVRVDPPHRGARLTGFLLARGVGNRAIDCVATGVQGHSQASGFSWPEKAGGDEGIWEMTGCVAHGNSANGIFVWQNTGLFHEVADFVSYHVGRSGVLHGAYRNGYIYRDSILYGSGRAGIELVANSRGEGIRIHDLLIDGADIARNGILVGHHRQVADRSTRVERCEFVRNTGPAISFTPPRVRQPDVVDIVDCTFDGTELWLADHLHPESAITITSGATTYAVRPIGCAGEPAPQWNAVVEPLA